MRSVDGSDNAIEDLAAFRVGDWEARRDDGTLVRDGKTRHLQPKVMQVLVYLTAHRERVVSKEELFTAVWPDTAVEDGALTQCIHAIRRAFGDDPRRPRYIKTVPRKGYRLVADVNAITKPEDPRHSSLAPAPAEQEPAVPTQARWKPIASALVLAILAFSAIFVRYFLQPPVRLMIQPLQAEEGSVYAQGLIEELRRRLVRSPQISLLSTISARRSVEDRLSLDEIKDRFDSDYVLTPRIQTLTAPGGGELERITLGLSRTDSGTEIWSEELDISTGLARISAPGEFLLGVAGALELEMSQEEQRQLVGSITADPEAMSYYLKALAIMRASVFDREEWVEASRALSMAVELDPDFLVAYLYRVQAHAKIFTNRNGTREQRDLAKHALERVQSLAPESPEEHLANAYFAYMVEEDYPKAEWETQQAIHGYQGDLGLSRLLGNIKRRQGELKEAIDIWQKLTMSEPSDARLLADIGRTHHALRRFPEARRWLREALEVDPGALRIWGNLVENALRGRSCPDNATVAEECSAHVAFEVLRVAPDHPWLIDYRFVAELYWASSLSSESEKLAGYAEALATRERVPSVDRDPALYMVTFWREAWILRLLGQEEELRHRAKSMLKVLEKKAEASPGSFINHAYLAIVQAFLSQPEATQTIAKAIELAERDRFSGPRAREYAAVTFMILGRRDAALNHLRDLTTTPYQDALTRAALLLDPIWRPLHDDPAFRELLSNLVR